MQDKSQYFLEYKFVYYWSLVHDESHIVKHLQYVHLSDTLDVLSYGYVVHFNSAF